jgi:hypothetical protein
MSAVNYLCPYCSTDFDTYEALKAHVIAAHGAEPLPKPQGSITITVNGQRYEHKVEANVTLYDLIHGPYGLHRVKMFCDRGRVVPARCYGWKANPFLHGPRH